MFGSNDGFPPVNELPSAEVIEFRMDDGGETDVIVVKYLEYADKKRKRGIETLDRSTRRRLLASLESHAKVKNENSERSRSQAN